MPKKGNIILTCVLHKKWVWSQIFFKTVGGLILKSDFAVSSCKNKAKKGLLFFSCPTNHRK